MSRSFYTLFLSGLNISYVHFRPKRYLFMQCIFACCMTSLRKELISILLVRLVIISRGYYTEPNEANFLQHSFMALLYDKTFFFRLNNRNRCAKVCVNLTRSRELCNIYLKDFGVILQSNVVRRVYRPRGKV
jgi:hypothetical protein